MAEIGIQDPATSEVQSPTVAGIIEALYRISGSMNMQTEQLQKVALSPVPGLNAYDPRRIYQAPGGSRIWLSYPEPIIYLNNVALSSSQYTIDYIGGSITFTGSYKPSSGDNLTVSCTHIADASYSFGGCELKITFSAAFSGRTFTVTGGSGESYTSIVPSSLVAYVSVKSTNTEYTISVTDANEEVYTEKVSTGAYYGQYEVTINAFSATIIVTAVEGAVITVKDSAQSSYVETADSDGKAVIYVSSADNYTVTSEYNGVSSNTQTVNVSQHDTVYNVSLSFITLLVTVETGSTVQAKNGFTTLTDTSDGTVLFYLPNTGTWTVTATKGDKSAETSVEVSGYQQYRVELTYEGPINTTLNDNTWEVISKVSASGKASSYWDVGDTKDIVLNGTIVSLALNSFTVSAFIIGFNHNSSKEGNNLIHFQIGKISQKNVAFIDSNYGKSILTGDSFQIHQGNSTSGGWNACTMRTNVLGNGANPTSPKINTFMAALPLDLRESMKSVIKYTDNTGKYSENDIALPGNVTATTDYLFLLSEFELTGKCVWANQYEQNSQSQYEYYSSGNSQDTYKHNSINTECIIWLRSPVGTDNHAGTEAIFPALSFCCRERSTPNDYAVSYYSYGFCPCFVV